MVALIAAAGAGRRMGGKLKQLRVLGRRPLLAQTARTFQNHARVSSVVLIVPPRQLDTVRSIFGAESGTKIAAVVAGGSTRTESIRIGLAEVPALSDIIIVHDAARPFVAPHEIDAVIDAAQRHGAASLAVEVADSIRRRVGEFFGEPVDREDTLRVQTPQAFRADVLKHAHEVARRANRIATDDVSLVMDCGTPVAIIRGSSFNLKITTPEDWLLARAVWPRWRRMHGLD